MKTLAVVNQKGGCGKTTVSVNLAACLSASGERILLVDLDPQGHASMALGIDSENTEPTVYEVLTPDPENDVSLTDVLLTRDRYLSIAPSNITLSALEQQLSGKKGREDRLRERLAAAAPHYDFCIIDCPPSVGLLTMNALRASQLALIPVEMSRFALHGLQKLSETVAVLCSRTSHSLKVRVVANMFESRTKYSRDLLARLKRDFGDSLCRTVINRSVKVAEGAMQGIPVRELAPYSMAHEDFVELAIEIATDPGLFETSASFPERAIFSYFDPDAQEVRVAGDFNGWTPSDQYALRRSDCGKWSLSLHLKAGKYRYKFVVDGEWRDDPSNPRREFGSSGQTNPVLEVN